MLVVLDESSTYRDACFSRFNCNSFFSWSVSLKEGMLNMDGIEKPIFITCKSKNCLFTLPGIYGTVSTVLFFKTVRTESGFRHLSKQFY